MERSLSGYARRQIVLLKQVIQVKSMPAEILLQEKPAVSRAQGSLALNLNKKNSQSSWRSSDDLQGSRNAIKWQINLQGVWISWGRRIPSSHRFLNLLRAKRL